MRALPFFTHSSNYNIFRVIFLKNAQHKLKWSSMINFPFPCKVYFNVFGFIMFLITFLWKLGDVFLYAYFCLCQKFYLCRKPSPIVYFLLNFSALTVLPITEVPSMIQNSRLEVLYKIGALRNFAKFTGKHLCRSLYFLMKLQAWGLQLYLKEFPTQVFSCEFCKNSKNFFFHRTPPVAASDDDMLPVGLCY